MIVLRMPCSPCSVLLQDNCPDNLPMMDGNCFCSCHITVQINCDFSIKKYQMATDQF